MKEIVSLVCTVINDILKSSRITFKGTWGKTSLTLVAIDSTWLSWAMEDVRLLFNGLDLVFGVVGAVVMVGDTFVINLTAK